MERFTVNQNGFGTWLEYRFSAAEEDSVIQGMLAHNRIPGLLPAEFSEADWGKLVRYDISTRISLAALMQKEMSFLQTAAIIKSITDTVSGMQDYLIGTESLVYEPERIYLDASGTEAELVCLPVLDWNCKKTQFRQFLRDILYGIRYPEPSDRNRALKLICFLNGTDGFSAADFSAFLERREEAGRIHSAGRAFLLREHGNEKIPIRKNPFCIGREGGAADCLIDGNQAVSRVHAVIEADRDRYFITDLNSTNHSFVDGIMIPAGMPMEIRPGSKIRLADENFEFTVL